MSETYDYVRYEDEYIKVEQIGKSGWIADFRVYTKLDNVKVVISQVTWTGEGLGYIDGVVFDDVIVSDEEKQAGFTIGQSDNPLAEHTEYTVMSSYELYIDGVYIDLVGFGFTFMTTSRYEAGALYSAPIIQSIREYNFYSEFSAVITINVNGVYCDYYIYVTITDSKGNVFSFDNTTLFMNNAFGDEITYIASIPSDDVGYGKIQVNVTTVASEKNSGSDYADVKTRDANFYRIFRFNNITGRFNLSAEEWNEFNELLAEEIPSYNFDGVMPGQKIDIMELNKPIIAYYNYKVEYYNGLTPRFMMHFGNAPEGAVTAQYFFETLEAMLNSFYTEVT